MNGLSHINKKDFNLVKNWLSEHTCDSWMNNKKSYNYSEIKSSDLSRWNRYSNLWMVTTILTGYLTSIWEKIRFLIQTYYLEVTKVHSHSDSFCESTIMLYWLWSKSAFMVSQGKVPNYHAPPFLASSPFHTFT